MGEIAFQLKVTNLTKETWVVSNRIFDGESSQLVLFKSVAQLKSALRLEERGLIKIEGQFLI